MEAVEFAKVERRGATVVDGDCGWPSVAWVKAVSAGWRLRRKAKARKIVVGMVDLVTNMFGFMQEHKISVTSLLEVIATEPLQRKQASVVRLFAISSDRIASRGGTEPSVDRL